MQTDSYPFLPEDVISWDQFFENVRWINRSRWSMTPPQLERAQRFCFSFFPLRFAVSRCRSGANSLDHEVELIFPIRGLPFGFTVRIDRISSEIGHWYFGGRNWENPIFNILHTNLHVLNINLGMDIDIQDQGTLTDCIQTIQKCSILLVKITLSPSPQSILVTNRFCNCFLEI